MLNFGETEMWGLVLEELGFEFLSDGQNFS